MQNSFNMERVVDVALIEEWKATREDEHTEFKEAHNNYDFIKLARYCCALANEGGGYMVLGMADKRPREVVGSAAFNPIERTEAGLMRELQVRVRATEVAHPAGRVVVFSVAGRPRGVPISYGGAYWMRRGEELLPLDAIRLRAIFDELAPDFSAEICPGATLNDLDTQAIEKLRTLWRRKSHNEALTNLAPTQLLTDAELLVEGKITYAALMLLGTRAALGRWLAQAEVIFEYRSSEASVSYQERAEFRQGFLLFEEEIWSLINRRNDRQHFQFQFQVLDIPTFNERATREAILNAVVHRNYQSPNSVWVRQYPRKLEVVSPGGFPPGITIENILTQQSPRNRRLAEVAARCGLIERSGQGVDLMFQNCIRESKPLPDYSKTSEVEVHLELLGNIQDPQFLAFLEKAGADQLNQLTTEDFLLLDSIHRNQSVPDLLKVRVIGLLERGLLEHVGRGRGVRYILSRQLYAAGGQAGVYTRRRGLDRDTHKMLLLQHIQTQRSEGSRLQELRQVLPELSLKQVQHLLNELKIAEQAHPRGRTNAARWFAGPPPAAPDE